MGNIIYRNLLIEDCMFIRDIDASQYIGNAWREINGERKLVKIDYKDESWPNGHDYHFNSLKKTILGGGSAIGAFDDDNKLIGFATVNKQVFGKSNKYVLLDQLFITLDQRGKGIGKKLFMLSSKVAKAWSVDKIYICAGSAEETVAFYFAIGCTIAEEINKELYESDPRDFQLEYIV